MGARACGADDAPMFEDQALPQQVTALPQIGHAPLHVCPSCSSPLVQLVAYEDAGEGHWALTLRCPECESLTAGVAADEACAELDRELERGTEELFTALLQVQRRQMVSEVDRFVAALRADLILPEDF